MLKTVAQKSALVGGAVGTLFMTAFILAGSASAQTVDPVEGAFTSMNDKIQTYGVAIVGLVVLAAGIFLGIKYLRKGVSHA